MKWGRGVIYALCVMGGYTASLPFTSLKEDLDKTGDTLQRDVERALTVPHDPLGAQDERDAKTRASQYWGEQYRRRKEQQP